MDVAPVDINAKLPIIIIDQANNINNNNSNTNNNNYTQTNGIENDHKQTNGFYETTSNKLPEVSFRRLSPPKGSKRKKKKERPRTPLPQEKEKYYHFHEPSAEDLFNLIEYDMDEDDSLWLKNFNTEIASKYNYIVKEDDFEKVMNRLEKESFFESKHSGKDVMPQIDDDAVCAICNDGEGYNTNAILFCDMCNLAVHQECYGVPYVPEGQWLCRRCLQSPSTNVDCILCPNKGGAFKQTDDNRWAHVICALWIPEVCFANTVFLEPIDNIQKIPQARWKLNCYICKQKKIGACIQCHKTNCYVPFHVTCAQQAGLYMKIQPFKYQTADGVMSDVKKAAFCDIHGPDDPDAGGGMYSSQDSSDEEESRIRHQKAREKMKKTRKILAEKRNKAFNPVSLPTVRPERLTDIGKLLSRKPSKVSGKRKFDGFLEVFLEKIIEHWRDKRAKRNGVPLIRRLQVSYQNNNISDSELTDLEQEEKKNLRRLRWDFEKARLLVGQVEKRERYKKQLWDLTAQELEKSFKQYDKTHPATD